MAESILNKRLKIMMKNRWYFIKPETALQTLISKELGINPVTAQIMINRGIKTLEMANSFINTTLQHFHDPDKMRNMKLACDRILKAVDSKEKIFIYGDYDVDGITATSLLVIFFREIGVNVEFYIPDRIKEGYGPNAGAIRKIHDAKCTLIITVDCGISALEEVKVAKELGIDIIITDHHQISDVIPDAYAILHPGQISCDYPFKHLAGVGIAFKLIKSLRRELVARGVIPEKLPNLKKHLDIVSLGTIADIAPLLDENHTIAKFGLKEITKTDKVGLKALIKASGLHGKEITVSDVGFTLGPRLNAIGRLGDAEIGVRLLITSDLKEASAIAEQLSSENIKRQKIQGEILAEAREMMKSVDLSVEKAIILESSNWHPGVIGIVASKLAEEFYKPTILIHLNGELGKGSARSIPAFHIYEGLKECDKLLLGFGGHKYAAGLSISKEMIPAFKEKFREVVSKNLNESDTVKQLNIDSVVNLSDLNMNTVTEIQRLAPFGPSNPHPLLCARGVKLSSKPEFIGKQSDHVRVNIEHDDEVMEIIAFNSRELFETLDPSEDGYDVAFIPELNNWGNLERIRLRLQDIRPHKKETQLYS